VSFLLVSGAQSAATVGQAHGFAFTSNRPTAPPADTAVQVAGQIRDAPGIPLASQLAA
jgi:hypothetical protein